MSNRKKLPFWDAFMMLFHYARVRIVEQIKSVAFIIIYLVAFQTLILGVPLLNAMGTAGGITLVVFGLAFFLEGLILGLMPLGERVGVKLPTKVGIAVIAGFGLLLGFGATLAEPAISALRTAGSSVTAWDLPLLYMMLERYTEPLVLSIGAGVGVAVALGMFKFYYNIPIKVFIFTIIPLLLVLTIIYSFDTNLKTIIGLAWDSGAVTTGAVTVPLVLALGIGVARSSSKGKGSSGGFGIILLASAFPVLAVLLLGLALNARIPKSTTEKDFFSIESREKALNIFGTEESLAKYAFTHGTEVGRRAYFGSAEEYEKVLISMNQDASILQSYIGNRSMSDWLINRASEFERNTLSEIDVSAKTVASASFSETIKKESIGGARSVIPLSFLLIIVLIIFLREKLRYKDEVALGIVFTLIGMTLLTSGIQLGLASLGGEVGSQLPRAFATEEKFIDRVVINNFETDLLYKGIASDGTQKTFFNMIEHDGLKQVEFDQERFDSENKRYEHIITQKPLFSKKLTSIGIVLVLLFAFGMGFGATLAEPALNALGITVEGLTVGALKRLSIVLVVSLGVGIGITLGISRILFDLPLVWLIVGSYILLIPLTILSEDEFSAIAWDSGGVTTGPVTVPLVLAMGLSIGGVLNVVDGFGVLALASAFPIITVLIYGLIAQRKQRRSIQETNQDLSDE